MPNDEQAPTFQITTTANPKQHRALDLIRQILCSQNAAPRSALSD
jgi:hypothetical protein